MKTHDNRALFSKALLKAATCFFLIAGAGMSPVFALQGTAESMKMEITQQTVTVSGVVKDQKGRTHHWCQYHGKRDSQRYHYRF